MKQRKQSVIALAAVFTLSVALFACGGGGGGATGAVINTKHPPAEPSSLVVTSLSESSIQLTWVDNSANETGFMIERGPSASGPFVEITTTTPDATTYNDGSLTAATTYYYRIAAVNSAGASPYLGPLGAATSAAASTAPSAPSTLTATAASSSSITLTWTDNSTDETGFKIERGASASGPFAQIATTIANTTNYSDTGLSASTTYYYRIRATNGAGDSAYTAVASASTPSTVTVPAAPSNLAASASSESSIALSWTDNSTDETGFKIERGASASGPFAQIATTTANTTNYSDTGLSASTTYYYRIRATNSAGDSAYSATASASTPAVVSIPAAPSGLTASAQSASSIALSWTDNSTNETGFKIERGASVSGPFAEIIVVGTDSTSYTDTGLNSSTTYYYRIRATNGAGDSAYTSVASAATSVVVSIPAAPSGLTATPQSTTSIGLSWTDNSNNETGFLIERGGSVSGPFAQIATTSANVTSYTNSGLSASTTYYYRVRAANIAGDSAYTAVASATTFAIASTPAAPSGLTASAQSTSSIALSWTDNAINESGFKIERGTSVSGPFAQIATTSANVTSYTNTGLSASTTYYYRVRATNISGDSAYTTVASATTPSASATVTLYPTADNLVMYNSADSSTQTKVYATGELAVGCNWDYWYDSVATMWIQDVVCAQSLVQFNITALSGKTIDSATLTLNTQYYGVGYYPKTWHIQALASAWSTSTVTWDVASTLLYYIASNINMNPPTYSGQVYNVDITATVQSWANGSFTNYGLIFGSNDYSFPYDTSLDAFAFYNIEAGQAWGPALTVTYH